MAQTDFSQQFDQVSAKAKSAGDKLRAAGGQTRDQLKDELAGARDKATEAADRLKDKAESTQEKASSKWQEVRDKWNEHVKQMKNDMERKREQRDAEDAATQADWAEAYALDTISFAEAVIEEAASAALDAVYLRAYARASAEKVGP